MKTIREQLGGLKDVLRNSSGEAKASVNYEKSLSDRKKNKKAQQEELVICPECKCEIKVSKFRAHMEAQHTDDERESNAVGPGAFYKFNSSVKPLSRRDYVKCPVCLQEVKRKNLEKHKVKAHGENEEKIAGVGIKGPVSREQAKEDLREIRKSIYGDDEIDKFIKRRPFRSSGIGVFGVPQDKYRWGFYGSHSMEYDIWGKGDKKK